MKKNVIFDYLEQSGTPIRDMLPKEVIRSAMQKDMMRAGSNKIVRIDNDTVDIYLSTEVLTAIEVGGITAMEDRQIWSLKLEWFWLIEDTLFSPGGRKHTDGYGFHPKIK